MKFKNASQRKAVMCKINQGQNNKLATPMVVTFSSPKPVNTVKRVEKPHTFNEKEIEEIKLATQTNDHNYARIRIAEKIKSDTLSAYNQIDKAQRDKGYMTMANTDKRTELDKKLMRQLKERVSINDYNKIVDAL